MNVIIGGLYEANGTGQNLWILSQEAHLGSDHMTKPTAHFMFCSSVRDPSRGVQIRTHLSREPRISLRR